jgi:hypothetical protein
VTVTCTITFTTTAPHENNPWAEEDMEEFLVIDHNDEIGPIFPRAESEEF